MRFTDFTLPECNYFREVCNFTEEELAIFDMRVKEKSLVQICFALNMSESTVCRKLKRIRSKIMKVL